MRDSIDSGPIGRICLGPASTGSRATNKAPSCSKEGDSVGCGAFSFLTPGLPQWRQRSLWQWKSIGSSSSLHEAVLGVTLLPPHPLYFVSVIPATFLSPSFCPGRHLPSLLQFDSETGGPPCLPASSQQSQQDLPGFSLSSPPLWISVLWGKSLEFLWNKRKLRPRGACLYRKAPLAHTLSSLLFILSLDYLSSLPLP